MFDLQKVIKEYTDALTQFEKEHASTTLQFGTSDSAMESRFPTGRMELEDKIKMLEDQIADLKKRLKSLKDLVTKKQQKSDTVTTHSAVNMVLDGESGWFLVSEDISDFKNGIISVETVLGKHILNAPVGEKTIKTENNDMIYVHIKDVIALVD